MKLSVTISINGRATTQEIEPRLLLDERGDDQDLVGRAADRGLGIGDAHLGGDLVEALDVRRDLRHGAELEPQGADVELGAGVAQGYATLGAIGFEGRWDSGWPLL